MKPSRNLITISETTNASIMPIIRKVPSKHNKDMLLYVAHQEFDNNK